MIIRENYLKKIVDAKDTEFIKVITGVRRSGKSTLLLMFRDYLKDHNVQDDQIIYINFESAILSLPVFTTRFLGFQPSSLSLKLSP